MVFFAEQPKIGQKTANGKHSYCWNDVNPSGMTIIPLKLLARHASFTTIPNWLHSDRLSRYTMSSNICDSSPTLPWRYRSIFIFEIFLCNSIQFDSKTFLD